MQWLLLARSQKVLFMFIQKINMPNIKSKISDEIAKKIFGKKENAEIYLLMLNDKREVKGLIIKNSKGKIKCALNTKQLWKAVVYNWNYDEALPIIRKIFKNTNKYKRGKEANQVMTVLLKEWKKLKLGNVQWPFSQGAFDEFVQRVNSENCKGLVKDEKVKNAAVKYRRIKEINTVRNDFIETLIFEKNHSILPTLNHRRGVDFFINGQSYDQKVAKSPTTEFRRHCRESWRDEAINNPAKVGKYLYTYQDEGRFGDDPRLLVVYIDEDVSIERIKTQIDNLDLNNPIEVNFTYKHKNQGEKNYKTHCFVILLFN